MKSYIHLYRTNSEFTEVYNGPDYDEPWLSLTEENMEINYSKTPPEPPKELTAITFGTITWVTDVPATGGTATKDNCTYTIIARYIGSRPEDITSQVDDVTGELVVEETTIEQRHEAGQLTLSASYCGFTATGNVTVYQEAAEHIPVVTSVTISNIECNVDAPAMGGTVYATDCTFEAYANYDDGSIEDVTSEATVEGELTVSKSKQSERHEAGTMTVTVTYSGVSESTTVTVYQEAFDYSKEPLTFIIEEGGTINWKAQSTAYTPTISYSKDDGETWTDITSSTAGTIVNVSAGDEVMFKGDNIRYANDFNETNTFSGSTAKFDIEGNIMSLIDSDGFATATTLQSSYTFMSIFRCCVNMVNASNLVLPATKLKERCYAGMFYNCTSLVTAPKLPATTLANDCYGPDGSAIGIYSMRGMFENCTSLTTAPELPATTLAPGCYQCMFKDCTSLTTAPELSATTVASNCYTAMFSGCLSLTTAPKLPATTLAQSCYYSMFQYCRSITSVPSDMLPATTLAQNCYQYMFYGCSGLITVPELPATTLTPGCYNEMFYGCTSLTTVPTDYLPATTLANYCYQSMFSNCSGLITVPELPATTLANYCYYQMFRSCTSLTTAPELPATTMAESCYQCMFQSCTALTTTPELPATTMANNCYYGMFQYCRSITSVPSDMLPATTLAQSCYCDMFSGCLSLTTAPELPATTLATECYKTMFSNCTSLTTVPADYLPATTLANYCYQSMFSNCSGLTTTPELPATTMVQNCYQAMFQSCKSLTTAPALPATTLANYCYTAMFSGCLSLTTAPELPAATLTPYCYQEMFRGCTSLNYIKCLATDISASNCTNGWVQNVQGNSGTFVKNPNMSSWTTGFDGIPYGWTVEDAS